MDFLTPHWTSWFPANFGLNVLLFAQGEKLILRKLVGWARSAVLIHPSSWLEHLHCLGRDFEYQKKMKSNVFVSQYFIPPPTIEAFTPHLENRLYWQYVTSLSWPQNRLENKPSYTISTKSTHSFCPTSAGSFELNLYNNKIRITNGSRFPGKRSPPKNTLFWNSSFIFLRVCLPLTKNWLTELTATAALLL